MYFVIVIYFCVFFYRCIIYYKIFDQNKSKFSPNSKKGIFLGFSEVTNSNIVMDYEDYKIHNVREIICQENEPAKLSLSNSAGEENEKSENVNNEENYNNLSSEKKFSTENSNSYENNKFYDDNYNSINGNNINNHEIKNLNNNNKIQNESNNKEYTDNIIQNVNSHILNK